MSHTISRLFDFAYHQLENSPQDKCFNYKEEDRWQSISTQEFITNANKVSCSLLDLGVKPNDKIAIISTNNNPNWHILDLGILQIGAQNVPLYATLAEKDYEYILNHSDAKYCFVSDDDLFQKVTRIASKTQLKNIFSLQNLQTDYGWSSFLKIGSKEKYKSKIEDLKRNIKTEDLATIIYTSGTTGTPKGVMLSHKNIIFTVFKTAKGLDLTQGNKRIISYLPICHIFERTASYYNLFMGFEVYFAESIENIGDTIRDVKPDYLAVVPRLLEKIFDKIIDKGSNLTGIKKQLFFWALAVGENYEPYDKNGSFYHFKLKIARKLIFSKWQEALGGNLKFMISGSAPLQQRLIRVFTAAGINVGLSICYDLRFPELYRNLTVLGADIITVPSAFTAVTGKVHWQALLQARAIENQVYVIAAGQQGVHENGRETWGHSMIISPWGEILACLDEGVGCISADFSQQALQNIRKAIPVAEHNQFESTLRTSKLK